MKNINLMLGNCLEQMKLLPENSVDSIVTDPPYGLSFMGKKWDYDVPSTEIWIEALRVLKPGGHLLAFFGTRTYHRGVVRIEDAGFEIRDQIMWIYGSGFPKSHNLKEQWQGWGSALKPANEPIVLARKPLENGLTLAENVLKYGTGALNIDASRVGFSDNEPDKRIGTNAIAKGAKGSPFNGVVEASDIKMYKEGRWPANIIFDEEAADVLGEPSRFFYVAKASKKERYSYLTCECETVNPSLWQNQDRNKNEQMDTTLPPKDICEKQSVENLNLDTSSNGSESTDMSLAECKSITSTMIQQTTTSQTCKSSLQQSIRESIQDVKSETASGLSRAKSAKSKNQSTHSIGTSHVKDGRSMGVAVNATLAESLKKNACVGCGENPRSESHPTQKPIKLMEYLIKLVTPPQGTVLDPFMGSGSTGVAAKNLGFKFIGIEMNEEYFKIATRRTENVRNI